MSIILSIFFKILINFCCKQSIFIIKEKIRKEEEIWKRSRFHAPRQPLSVPFLGVDHLNTHVIILNTHVIISLYKSGIIISLLF